MSKKAILIPVVVLGMAAGLLFTINGCWTTWEGGGAEQRTDDAYVRADMTPMSTRISGTVRSIDVQDFQKVTPGQTLVQLDDADYQAMLAQSEAALAGSKAALANNQAAKRIQDAKVENAETTVQQAEGSSYPRQRPALPPCNPRWYAADWKQNARQRFWSQKQLPPNRTNKRWPTLLAMPACWPTARPTCGRAQAMLSSSRALPGSRKAAACRSRYPGRPCF